MDMRVFESSFFYEQGPNILAEFSLVNEQISHIDLSLNLNSGFSWKIFRDQKFSKIEEKICQWMENYALKKDPCLHLPLLWENVPPYTSLVLSFLQTLPFGKTVSYQEAAILTGKPKAARAVGNACGNNPFPLIIPCHRVLASNSRLGGYSAGGGLDIKKELLHFEGISLAK